MKELIKKYWYIIIFIIILVGFITKEEPDKGIVLNNEEVIEKVENIYIDIKGEVVNPGVYEVSNNSRIKDVIDIAGGLTKNADISLLNLSKKVSDEMNIKIYSKKEVKDAISKINTPTIVEVIKEIEKECVCPDVNDACDKVSTNKEETNKVNINNATKEELMSVSGLGESKANSIIEYRQNNKFNVIEDIQNISGIGDALFNKIKNYIEV